MIMNLPDWSSFKATCITKKNLNCQYSEESGRYILLGPDANGILWEATLLKSSPASADQTDFETNYKGQLFNFAIGSRPYSFATPDFMFGGDSILATVTKNSTTNVDFLIPGSAGTFKYVNGAIVFTKDAVFGDYASAVIIDKNNILGYGLNTILATYITRWYINPGSEFSIETPYAGKLLAGLFIRLAYTSVGLTTDPTMAVNYRLHTPL